MAKRAQALELLEQEHTYEKATRELKIPPGHAFMIRSELKGA
jgi:hypothetical protein